LPSSDTDGSHRQFKHPTKIGRVTVSGKLSDNLAPGTLNSIYKQAGWKWRLVMKYAVVIENAGNNFSAYVPDVPGCVATGPTVEEVENGIRSAIQIHLRGLKEDGQPIPKPSSAVEYVEVAA
jgi:predicted RNase H-like HicB family nuclease